MGNPYCSCKLTGARSATQASPQPKRTDLGAGGIRTSCPSAPKTFLNSKSCVRRPECVTPLEYSDTTFVLNETMVRTLYTMPSIHRHVYIIDDLQFEMSTRAGYNPYDFTVPEGQSPPTDGAPMISCEPQCKHAACVRLA